MLSATRPAERGEKEMTMYDVSDRFLHQLTAERRESLLRSARASTQRPLRRALWAALARLGLASGGVLDSTPSLDRTSPALASTEEPRCLQDGSTGSTGSTRDIDHAAAEGARPADREHMRNAARPGSPAGVRGGVLTRREHQVVLLVAEGLTNAEIGRTLWVSPGTVRRHLENVFAKLDVHTRTAAVARIRDAEPRP
jgi:DNA-binding CsgD family transcriptional regulator